MHVASLKSGIGLALAALAATSLLSVSLLHADEGAVKIESSSITSEFPAGFRIRVKASSDSEVKSIAVRIKMGQQTHGAYDYLCQHTGKPASEGGNIVLGQDWICEDFERGTVVDGELFWRTNSSPRYVPPGTVITYSFEVEDADGIALQTEPEQFIYQDARFEWQEVSDGPITVSYHGPVKTRAGTILQAMIDTLAHMGPLLGAETEELVRVTMYNNVKEMMEALPPRSATVGRELITEGQAFSELGTLLVLGGTSLSEGTASHELTHILVHRAGQGLFRPVPAWLNEGLAEYGNVQPGYSYDIALEFALETGRLLPVTSMTVLPGDPEAVIIFYGQSRSMIQMMIARFGTEKMNELMATLKSGINIDDALLRVYGVDRVGLDNMWREALGTELFVATETGVSRPTPIPRRTILPYSFTPHPQAEAIGPTSDDATPESRDAAAGQGSAQEASPVAGAKTEPGPSDPEAEDAGPRAIAAGADVGDALTPEPGEQERQEAAPTGGGCRASAGGTPDVAHVAILLGLVGAGLRRRWRGGAKGEG